MPVLLGISALALLAVTAPLLAGGRHLILLSSVIVLVFISGFGIKGEITSPAFLLVDAAVNLIVAALIFFKVLPDHGRG